MRRSSKAIDEEVNRSPLPYGKFWCRKWNQRASEALSLTPRHPVHLLQSSMCHFTSINPPVALSLNFPFSRPIKCIKAPHNSAAADIYRRQMKANEIPLRAPSRPLERQIEKRINIFQLKLIIQRAKERKKGLKRVPFARMYSACRSIIATRHRCFNLFSLFAHSQFLRLINFAFAFDCIANILNNFFNPPRPIGEDCCCRANSSGRGSGRTSVNCSSN